jgi:hypothetical protein
MRIKYSWSPATTDPKEVTTIELECKSVPRVGELVDISIQIKTDEWCKKEGRVKDVCWLLRNGMNRGPEVTVILGA